MKTLVRLISNFFLIRWISLLITKIIWVCSRFWSHFRFKSLVVNSGDSVCHFSVEIKYGNNIVVGNNVAIGPNCSIGAMSKIVIGDNVTLSRGVIVETAGLNLSTLPPYKHQSKPIIIEDGVWIASNAIILGGVTIKRNALIGAGAVITKDIPEEAIIVGARNRTLR